MDKRILRIKELTILLNKATEEYDKGTPTMTDEEWDNLYFELKTLEEECDFFFKNSPTHKIHFKKVSELKKVKHNHPMLSLDKTKEIKEVKSFVKDHQWIAMAKMDGLTCSLTYFNGKLVGAETRGNGIEGEDITHNALVIPSIPKQIPSNSGTFVVDGEIICTYSDFELFKKEYKNPRNFASGSIRLLDSKECQKRHLTFVAWDSFGDNGYYKYNSENSLSLTLQILQEWGFIIVPNISDVESTIDRAIDYLKEKSFDYPIDGIVFKYDDVEEYEAAGRTDHHFKGGLAYKFYDELYDTHLKHIEWSMGRTGILTPVAVFDPIDIDGSTVKRASLHNISIMKELLGTPYVGQKIQVTKMNQIIPQIISAEKIPQ